MRCWQAVGGTITCLAGILGGQGGHSWVREGRGRGGTGGNLGHWILSSHVGLFGLARRRAPLHWQNCALTQAKGTNLPFLQEASVASPSWWQIAVLAPWMPLLVQVHGQQ